MFMSILLIVIAFGIGFLFAFSLDNDIVVGEFVINETDPSAELFSINFEKDIPKDEEYIRFKIVRK